MRPPRTALQLFRVVSLAIAVMALSGLAGCGKKAVGPAGSVAVSGKITCGGEPVPQGSIIFQADKGGSVTAKIGAGGSFQTMLVPGEHLVVVNAKDGVDTMDEKGNPVPARSLVPEKYSSGKTSGLKVTVSPKGDPLTIALEK
jgi:hypothetical protein